MTEKELAREIRKQRRLERLGTNDPICGTCGFTRSTALERHHVAGRKHDSATAISCRNCHRDVTDSQKDHPAFDPAADSLLQTIAFFLFGLADLLELAIEKLTEFGLALFDRAKTANETGA